MSEDIHNIDEFFKAAYEQFSDTPSPAVWDKLNAGLDKNDAVAYKKRSKRWKLVAIFSLLLLTGVMLYETKVVKTSFRHSDISTSATVETNQQGKKPEVKETVNRIHPLAHDARTSTRDNANDQIENDKVSTAVPGSFNRSTRASKLINKSGGSINHIEARLAGSQKQSSPVRSAAGESDENIFRSSAYSLREQIIVPSVEQKYHGEIRVGQLTYIPSSRLNGIAGLSSKANSNPKNPFSGQNKWSVTAFVSSDRAGYRLDRDQPTIVQIKEHEDHLPSFSAGILLTRQIKKRFGLQTGLIYSDISIAIGPQNIYASQNQTGKVLYKYVTSSGNAYIKPNFVATPYPGDSLKAENAQHNLQYIAVPLIVKYNLIDGNRITLSPGVGISGNFLANAKIETEVEGLSNREHIVINKLEGIRTFNCSLIADASLDYLVNKKVSLSLRPSFTYALSPSSSTDNLETFPYSFGVGIGVTYRF